MAKMWLGLAAGIAAIAIATPAAAGTPEEAFVGFPNANPTVGFSGQPAPGFAGGGFHLGFGHPGFGDHHSGRFGRGHGSGASHGTWVNGGQWALYNNRSFQSDSYNDWWHDRPDRAYPAWVRNNQPCRPYWSGGGWRC